MDNLKKRRGKDRWKRSRKTGQRKGKTDVLVWGTLHSFRLKGRGQMGGKTEVRLWDEGVCVLADKTKVDRNFYSVSWSIRIKLQNPDRALGASRGVAMRKKGTHRKGWGKVTGGWIEDSRGTRRYVGEGTRGLTWVQKLQGTLVEKWPGTVFVAGYFCHAGRGRYLRENFAKVMEVGGTKQICEDFVRC